MSRPKPESKKNKPLVFRISEEQEARLEVAADRIGLKKYTLGLAAIDAAISAIEAHGGKLVLPVGFSISKIEFSPTHVPRELHSKTLYPLPGNPEISFAEDKPDKGGSGAVTPSVGKDTSDKVVDAVKDIVEGLKGGQAKPAPQSPGQPPKGLYRAKRRARKGGGPEAK